MATQTKTKIQYFYKGKEVSKERLANIFMRHLKEENLFYSECVNMKGDNYLHFKTFLKNGNPCYWTNILSPHLRIKFKNVWFPLVTTSEIEQVINKFFDLTPNGIINRLELRRPIYAKLGSHGHFGRLDLDLPWEKLDYVDKLKDYITKK